MDRDLASRQQARDLVAVTRSAFERYRTFDQGSVDRICHAVVEAGYREAERLARMAVEETDIGKVASKKAKNEFATRGLWRGIRDMATCGLVGRDPARGVDEYADPFGVVAAIIPTTNPTSTALFKAIICLKSRNGMVTSPHPRAVGCIRESIRVVMDAAVAAGAPEGLITCMDQVSLDGTEELMKHPNVDLILATGGSGLVRAAYSSGKPAFGVGPGNSPSYVDRSADLDHAARCIVDSQTFDNGTICSSEQSLVLDRPIRDGFLTAMKARGAHLCTPDEAELLEKIVMKGRGMNPDIVGKDPWRLAEMAGFQVPRDTTVLLAHCAGVGFEFPLSIEKLSPILSVFVEDGWEKGCKRCLEILALGGMGHTLSIHCRDEAIIREFAEKKPVNRILVNSPSSQGAVGFTTNLFPSMTLGCGSFGGNITSDNISPLHLLNIKRLARVKPEYDDPSWTGAFEDAGPSGSAPVGDAPRSDIWMRRSDDSAGEDVADSKRLWQPHPAEAPGGPAEPLPDELETLVQSLLAKTRDDGCPFGRCADCPPSGGSCDESGAQARSTVSVSMHRSDQR